MKLKQKTHAGSTLFSFLLLLVFTMFTLMLAGTGAAVYKNSTARLNENYTSRTAVAYISEKIRQHNSEEAVFFSAVEDQEALVLREVISEEFYLTYIYYYDGALCELFVREDTVPSLQSGTRIVELESLEIRQYNAQDILSESNNISGLSESLNPDTDIQTASILSVTAKSPEGDSLSILLHYCGRL